MTSEGLVEMFEGDSADMCGGKFPLVSMGGRAEGLACADPGARTPIGASGIMFFMFLSWLSCFQFQFQSSEKCELYEIKRDAWLHFHLYIN